MTIHQNQAVSILSEVAQGLKAISRNINPAINIFKHERDKFAIQRFVINNKNTQHRYLL